MNKMDEYYKKQLTDYQPAADEWNIPSEELWNNAKPHFPKPKKKRGTLILLLLLTIVIPSTYFLLEGFSIKRDTAINYDSNSSDQHNSTIDDLPINKNKYNNSLKNRSASPSIKIDDYNSNAISKEIIKESSPIAQHNNIISWDKSNYDNKAKLLSSNNTSSFAIEPKTNTTFKTKSNNTSNDHDSHNDIIHSTKVKVNAKKIANPKQYINPIVSPNNHSNRTINTIAYVNQLDLLLLASEDLERPLSFRQNLTSTLLPSVSKTGNHEVGIGSTLHLLTLIGEVKNGDNDEWPDEEIFFKSSRNKNINLHYQYALSRKWYISSGLYYHHINFNLYGFTYDVLTQSTLDDFISTNLNDQLNANLTDPRQSNDQKIELISGQSVSTGDTLKFGLDVSLSLNTLQIPLVINRKWGIKQTEVFIGIGGSVNFESWKQNSADVQLFKDNILITKPYSEGAEPPNRKTTFEFIFQTGIDYKITDNLKIGLAGRIFLPGLIPTGLEARLMYRL